MITSSTDSNKIIGEIIVMVVDIIDKTDYMDELDRLNRILDKLNMLVEI